MTDQLSLCLVTNHHIHQAWEDYLQFLAQAIQGGVTSIQYRDKTNPLSVVRKTAFILKRFLTPYRVPLIINDYVDIAVAVDADGVHVGQSDLTPFKARAMLGPNKLIGYSIESIKQLEHANQIACLDYVAASAIFPSQTKPDCQTIWGLDGLSDIARLSKHPVIAIGGINVSNAAEVIKQGADGIAVVSAIHDQPDPAQAASLLIQQIEEGKKYV